MNKFTFYWRDGKHETLDGTDPANALNNAGYGNGALRALDFYKKGKHNDEYAFDRTTCNWASTTQPQQPAQEGRVG